MLAVDMVLVGVGIGATMPLFTISLQSQFPTRMGEVTGALQFFRSIGGTVGVALLGGVMNAAFARELGVLLTEQSARFGDAFPMLSKLAEEPGKLLNAGAMEASGRLAARGRAAAPAAVLRGREGGADHRHRRGVPVGQRADGARVRGDVVRPRDSAVRQAAPRHRRRDRLRAPCRGGRPALRARAPRHGRQRR